MFRHFTCRDRKSFRMPIQFLIKTLQYFSLPEHLNTDQHTSENKKHEIQYINSTVCMSEILMPHMACFFPWLCCPWMQFTLYSNILPYQELCPDFSLRTGVLLCGTCWHYSQLIHQLNLFLFPKPWPHQALLWLSEERFAGKEKLSRKQ